jgi:hypothetical protein
MTSLELKLCVLTLQLVFAYMWIEQKQLKQRQTRKQREKSAWADTRRQICLKIKSRGTHTGVLKGWIIFQPGGEIMHYTDNKKLQIYNFSRATLAFRTFTFGSAEKVLYNI